MRENHQSFSDALDIYGFRVIVRSVDDCYLALGALHRLYKPIHRRFKDFIAIPKLNGYPEPAHDRDRPPTVLPVEIPDPHRADASGRRKRHPHAVDVQERL